MIDCNYNFCKQVLLDSLKSFFPVPLVNNVGISDWRILQVILNGKTL